MSQRIHQIWAEELEPEQKTTKTILLLHEKEEHSLMYESGMSYREAHAKANERYNWEATFNE